MGIFLNAGSLKSPNYTIGDYKILWKLNSSSGDTVFISGEGNDVTLQSQHPLVDEVVVAGNLYPEIEYVYINGRKVTSAYEIGIIFSPDLVGCLNSFTIDAIGCSVDYNPNNVYNFILAYNNTSNVSQNKSRTLTYNISASANYLAWQFLGETIADGLKFYYCTNSDPVGTLIDNYIIGEKANQLTNLVEDLSPTDYPNNPRVINNFTTGSRYTYYRSLTDLRSFTYTAGDYIRIEITGSVLDLTNDNTNWNLGLTCVDTFDSTTFNTEQFNKWDNNVIPYMDFDSGICRYYCHYGVLEEAYLPYLNTVETIDLLKYLFVVGRTYNSTYGSQTGAVNMLGTEALIGNRWQTSVQNGYTTQPNYICLDLPEGEEIIINKTIGNVQITLSSLSEYNDSVDDINAVINHATWAEAKAALPTEIEYYLRWTIATRVAESCGDSYIGYQWALHHTAVITYDPDNLTINFTCPPVVNQLIDPNEECNNLWSSVNSNCDRINADAIEEQGIISSPSGLTHHIAALKTYSVLRDDPVVYQQLYYLLPLHVFDHIITPAELQAIGFCIQDNRWVFYKQYDRLTFTNVATHKTRLSSFTIERQIGLRTNTCIDVTYGIVDNNYELIYTSPNTVIGEATTTGTLTNATP